jgi:hypothetical protein
VVEIIAAIQKQQQESSQPVSENHANRSMTPCVVLTRKYAVERINSGGCGRVIGFTPAVNGEAFSLSFRNSVLLAGDFHSSSGDEVILY